jgi:hypothetical protein
MNANETDTESTRLEHQGSTVAGTERPDLSNVSDGRGQNQIHGKGPLHTFAPDLDHRICETAFNPFRQRDQFQTVGTTVIRTSLVLYLVGTSAASQSTKATNQKGSIPERPFSWKLA